MCGPESDHKEKGHIQFRIRWGRQQRQWKNDECKPGYVFQNDKWEIVFLNIWETEAKIMVKRISPTKDYHLRERELERVESSKFWSLHVVGTAYVYLWMIIALWYNIHK